MDRRTVTRLKGIAIIMIVTFHVLPVLGIREKLLMLLLIQGNYLFIFLSGYGLSKKYNNKEINAVNFYKQRIVKVYPLYLFIMFLIVVFSLTNKLLIVQPLDLTSILLHISLLHLFSPTYFYSISPVFWFIGTIFQLYIIFPFIYKRVRASIIGITTFLLLLSIAVFSIDNFDSTLRVFRFGLITNYLLSFFLGIYFAKEGNLKEKKLIIYFLLILTSFFNVFYFINKDAFGLSPQTNYFDTAIEMGAIHTTYILILFPLIWIAKRFGNKILEFIGIISFEVFLVHYSLLNIVKRNNFISLIYYVFFIFLISAGIYVLQRFWLQRINIKLITNNFSLLRLRRLFSMYYGK